jgi:hypothetical protein
MWRAASKISTGCTDPTVAACGQSFPRAATVGEGPVLRALRFWSLAKSGMLAAAGSSPASWRPLDTLRRHSRRGFRPDRADADALALFDDFIAYRAELVPRALGSYLYIGRNPPRTSGFSHSVPASAAAARPFAYQRLARQHRLRPPSPGATAASTPAALAPAVQTQRRMERSGEPGTPGIRTSSSAAPSLRRPRPLRRAWLAERGVRIASVLAAPGLADVPTSTSPRSIASSSSAPTESNLSSRVTRPRLSTSPVIRRRSPAGYLRRLCLPRSRPSSSAAN